jgi:hypothetical protein
VPYSDVVELAAEEDRRGLVRRDNAWSSRHTGVSWNTANKKWRTQLHHGGMHEHLGYFPTEEAAKASYAARCLELGRDPDKRKASGFRGVHWAKAKGKWKAEIKIDGKTEYLGSFEPTPAGEIDAALAYDSAARAVGRRPKSANFEPVDAPPLPGAGPGRVVGLGPATARGLSSWAGGNVWPMATSVGGSARVVSACWSVVGLGGRRGLGHNWLAALGRGGAGHGGGGLGGRAAVGPRRWHGGGLHLGGSPSRIVAWEAGGGSGPAGVPYSAAELAAEWEGRGLVRRDNSWSSRHNGVSWNTMEKKWRAQLTHGGKQEFLGDFPTEEAAKERYDARCLELGLDPDKRKASGFHGVVWHRNKARGKWRAIIKVDGNTEHLGLFEPTPAGEVDAALAYDAAARAVGRRKSASFEPVVQ